MQLKEPGLSDEIPRPSAMSGSDVIDPEMSFEDEEQTENNIRVEPETPCELNEISDMVLSEPDSQQKLSVSLDRNI